MHMLSLVIMSRNIVKADAEPHLGETVVTIIWVNLQDKSQNSSNLKIPALTFLRTALESTDPSVWQKHLPVLSPAVFATVGERYYKVTAQGLRVAERLIFVIRPSTQSQIPGNTSVRLHAFCHYVSHTSPGVICM